MAVAARPEGTAQVAPSAVGERSFDRLAQVIVALLTLVLVLFPVVPILYQSVNRRPLYDRVADLTGSNFARVFSSGEFWRTMGATVVFAALTTLLAVALGTVLAVLLTRTDLPGRGLFVNFVALPFYVSPLVLAFAWRVVFGPQGYFTILARTLPGHLSWNLFSLGGIVVVSAMYYAPYTYLYCTASLGLADPQVEDAGRIAGAGPLRTLWAVTLPLLRPALLYSALLTLVSSIELLSIPLVLGTPSNVQVLATYIFKLGLVGATPDYGAIAAISIVTILLVSALLWLQERLTALERRFVTVGGKATRARLLKLGPLRWVALALVAVYVLIGILLPLLGIVAQSATAILSPLINPWELRTSENYATVFHTPPYFHSITNSILVSVLGAAVGIAFIAFVALIVNRSDFPGRRALAYLALYPRAIPGLIVGVGFLYAFLLVPGLGGVRNTLFALGLAFIMRHLPLGFGAVSPSILRISPELDRAARVSGTTWLGTVRSILLPLLRPALLSGYILLFVTFLKEYSTALFLFAPGSEVIGTTMIQLSRQGETGAIAALATVQMGITVVVLFISRALLGVKLYGDEP